MAVYDCNPSTQATEASLSYIVKKKILLTSTRSWATFSKTKGNSNYPNLLWKGSKDWSYPFSLGVQRIRAELLLRKGRGQTRKTTMKRGLCTEVRGQSESCSTVWIPGMERNQVIRLGSKHIYRINLMNFGNLYSLCWVCIADDLKYSR